MDWNPIARTERNSLSLRQLVHPGCQNTFSAVVADMLASMQRTDHGGAGGPGQQAHGPAAQFTLQHRPVCGMVDSAPVAQS